jgi:alpha-D-xyloside xylohydrolase
MSTRILNQNVDPSYEFISNENTLFVYDKAVSFDESLGIGRLSCGRHERKNRMAFNQMESSLEPVRSWEFPPIPEDKISYPFDISFIDESVMRIRISSNTQSIINAPSLMIDKEFSKLMPSTDSSEGYTEYSTGKMKVRVEYEPFHITIMDEKGRVLTKTHHMSDSWCLKRHMPMPLCFTRKSEDMSRYTATTFSLAHDEKIFGCGESFTRLNKRGQRVNLYTTDAHGAQFDKMYKPVPFFMSSRGYGMFVHSTYPMTFDFGAEYDGATTIYNADPIMDIFIFVGNPKEIIGQYTDLTGKSPVPPLWSFGLWMSRITYESEQEAREVANNLREKRIPCDVIHLDTGWFEKDWCCDYRFSEKRFDDPKKMMDDLKDMGYHISLWQLPYYTVINSLYNEIVENGYAVKGQDGGLATNDAILDFSNPDAANWYKENLRYLFDLGIGAIKADFGEAAPIHGRYHSGKSGLAEHNIYPLRYNKAVYEITNDTTGEPVIWARSAWAGSQRYPIHWGGDAENTDSAMASTLRAGLSLGICGFSFWSHDIGGFVKKSPEELYKRWMPFGMLTSHSRCHGAPPKEPWLYSEEFTESFRQSAELKYALMPYIYSQAVKCSETGLPMMRALFIEYPEDKTSWMIEDEYLFGDNLLVAPLFEENTCERSVYLPQGEWIDYQTRERYEGGKWYTIKASDIPIVLLVKAGSAIPQASIAQHTGDIDWNNLIINTFTDQDGVATGYLAIPDTDKKGVFKLKKSELVEGDSFIQSAINKID